MLKWMDKDTDEWLQARLPRATERDDGGVEDRGVDLPSGCHLLSALPVSSHLSDFSYNEKSYNMIKFLLIIISIISVLFLLLLLLLLFLFLLLLLLLHWSLNKHLKRFSLCPGVSSPSSFTLKTNTISTSVPNSYYPGSEDWSQVSNRPSP